MQRMASTFLTPRAAAKQCRVRSGHARACLGTARARHPAAGRQKIREAMSASWVVALLHAVLTPVLTGSPPRQALPLRPDLAYDTMLPRRCRGSRRAGARTATSKPAGLVSKRPRAHLQRGEHAVQRRRSDLQPHTSGRPGVHRGGP